MCASAGDRIHAGAHPTTSRYRYANIATPPAVSDVYMISSTVSSKILKSMAAVEGFHHVETLTGYKWMANEADRLLKLGKVVLFTFEEAIG